MSDHTCVALNHGCYRCELNIDEIRSAIEEATTEAREHEAEARMLRRDIKDMRRALARWEAGVPR